MGRIAFAAFIGFAVGMLGGLTIASIADKPGRVLKETKAELAEVERQRAELEAQLGNAKAEAGHLVEEKAEMEAELVAAKDNAQPRREQPIAEKPPAEPKTFFAGVSKVEDALTPFFGNCRLKLRELPDGENSWHTELFRDGAECGIVEGVGDRDNWQSAFFSVFPGESRNEQLDSAFAAAAFLRVFTAVDRPKSEDWVVRAMKAAQDGPDGAFIEQDFGGEKASLYRLTGVGLYCLQIKPK